MKFISVLLIVFFTQNCFSQDKCGSANKKLRKIEKHIAKGDNNKAVNLLLKIEDKCDEELFLISVADIYYSLNKIKKSYLFYLQSFQKGSILYMNNISVSNFLKSSYSTGHYNTFNDIINDSNFKMVLNKELKRIKEKNSFAINNKNDSIIFNPNSIDINSSNDEYFPSMPINSDILIFTYRNNDSLFQDENFYISRKINGSWQFPLKLGDNINSTYREGSLSVSLDGKDIYFASCHRPDSYGGCDLYYSTLINDTLWSQSNNIGSSINTKYWETQPSISADGNTLFFVSNRYGGYGGSDIWMSKKINSIWSEPINLGPEVNTSSDESTPFLHYDNKTLYFASKGHKGFGGYDVFSANIDNQGKILNVSNLGYPINTHYDESGLIVARDGKQAYYNSNVTDDLNIYSFNLPEKNKANSIAIINGIVIDSISQLGMEAEIIINELNSIIEYKISSDDDGVFSSPIPLNSEFSITVLCDGYDFFSSNYYLNKNEYIKDVVIVLNRLNIGNKINLENIYYEFNDYSLKEESLITIQKLANYLLVNPNIKIQIEGHTDNIGSKSYNNRLSEKRAKSVYLALIQCGISPYQLSYKGYGFSIPLIDEDNDLARIKNRRTEIKIIGDYE